MSEIKKFLEDFLKYEKIRLSILDIKKFEKTYPIFQIAQMKEVLFETKFDGANPAWPTPIDTKNVYHYALIGYQNYYLLLKAEQNNFGTTFKALKSSTLEQMYEAIQNKIRLIDDCFHQKDAFHLGVINSHIEKIQLEKNMINLDIESSNKTKLKL